VPPFNASSVCQDAAVTNYCHVSALPANFNKASDIHLLKNIFNATEAGGFGAEDSSLHHLRRGRQDLQNGKVPLSYNPQSMCVCRAYDNPRHNFVTLQRSASCRPSDLPELRSVVLSSLVRAPWHSNLTQDRLDLATERAEALEAMMANNLDYHVPAFIHACHAGNTLTGYYESQQVARNADLPYAKQMLADVFAQPHVCGESV
jgi:hypothetical protein